MQPFQPIGERARWRTAYDLLRKAATGTVVTYEELAEALGLDADKDRHAIQMAVRRAAREHEEQDNRVVDVVPNSGYTIVPPSVQLNIGRRHHKKAGKSLARGHSKVIHVDLSGIDPETRNAFEVMAHAFAAQMDFNRRFEGRQAKIEEAISAMTNRNDRTEQEIAELNARLARIEGERPTP